MTTILITCAGSGVGQSVIDSLNLKQGYRLIGCDGNPDVYAHAFCDRFFTVPSIYSEGYVDFLIDLCVRESISVVIPGHDHELLVFAKEIEKFHIKGIEVVVSEPDVIEASRDKQRWYDYFAPHGCRIVPTFSVKEFRKNPDPAIFPAIVKPVGGSASQGILILNGLSELGQAGDDDIIQPYLFPEKNDKNYNTIVGAVKKGRLVQLSEISIQLVFSKKSKLSGIFISKNTLKSGVPVFVDPIRPESFEYLDEILKFVPVCEKKGVKGPVNIQGRVTEKGIFFFEMNMRFTGITGNRALLGFNEVDFLVQNFLGRPAKLEGFAYNKLGVRQVACSTIPRQGEKHEKETLTILGGGSNVGHVFITSVADNYHKINVIVRSESLNKYHDLFKAVPNVLLVKEDDISLEQVLCQTDVLVNFVSALAYKDDVLKYDAIRFIQRMTVKIAKAKIDKIVNISSQSVYPQDLNIAKPEEEPVHCLNGYAFQKVIMEDMFAAIKEFHPLSKVISLRLTRIVAPSIVGQAGFFGKMVQDYIQGNTITISHPANNTNLIHVNDVVSAIQFVLGTMDNQSLPEVLNVGGQNLTMRDYAIQIKELVSGQGSFVFGDNAEVKSSSMVDGQRLSELGWNYKYRVVDIIDELRN